MGTVVTCLAIVNDQGLLATLVLARSSAVLFTLPAHTLVDICAAMARGPVEGSATGNLIIVTPGLSSGERIMADGHYKLQRNASVTFSSPASPQTAGSGGNS
jgi:hypothetical protein